MAGERRWQAFVNAAARGGGSDFPVRGDLPHPITDYPKYLAQLEYTTADVRYLSQWWAGDPIYPPMEGSTFVETLEPTHADLIAAFDQAEAWLANVARTETSFDGGGLVFSFSGHGRPKDGTLLLPEYTYFSADDFIERAAAINRATGSSRPTRIVLLLDSCYSGAFLVHVIHRIATEPNLGLDFEFLLASSHPDEVSWESPSLGHGLSTYCFSLRESSIGSGIAIGGRHGIKTWSAHAGPAGCSIATGAAQNPIVFQYGEMDTCFQDIQVDTKSEEQLLDELRRVRDDLRERFAPIRTRTRSDLTDAEIARDMEEQLELSARSNEVSSEDRAESLRAWRQAWWIDPAGRWS